MKVIAGAGNIGHDFNEVKKFLSVIGEGIILFCEGSFDPNESHRLDNEYPKADWGLEDLATYTKSFPMTLIGEKNGRIYIVRGGKILKAQMGWFDIDEYPELESRYRKYDKLYNVSYDSSRKVLALCRICADADTPYVGDGKADLLLISSGGMDWSDNLDTILDVHKNILSPNGLIVQSDMSINCGHFIYSLKLSSMVGTVCKYGGEYTTHEI